MGIRELEITLMTALPQRRPQQKKKINFTTKAAKITKGKMVIKRRVQTFVCLVRFVVKNGEPEEL